MNVPIPRYIHINIDSQTASKRNYTVTIWFHFAWTWKHSKTDFFLMRAEHCNTKITSEPRCKDDKRLGNHLRSWKPSACCAPEAAATGRTDDESQEFQLPVIQLILLIHSLFAPGPIRSLELSFPITPWQLICDICLDCTPCYAYILMIHIVVMRHCSIERCSNKRSIFLLCWRLYVFSHVVRSMSVVTERSDSSK